MLRLKIPGALLIHYGIPYYIMNLNIQEIFLSLEGETRDAGFPALFIRLASCNLSCLWCDTVAHETGRIVPIDDLVDMAASHPWVHHITLTGGEPLNQPHVTLLMERLVALNIAVQLETNGTLNLDNIPNSVRKIVDIKPPSSSHGNSFLIDNLRCLTPADEIKIVAADKKDLAFITAFLADHGGEIPCIVNLTPAHPSMHPGQLAAFILENRINARLNLQQHKLIWHDKNEAGLTISLEKYPLP